MGLVACLSVGTAEASSFVQTTEVGAHRRKGAKAKGRKGERLGYFHCGVATSCWSYRLLRRGARRGPERHRIHDEEASVAQAATVASALSWTDIGGAPMLAGGRPWPNASDQLKGRARNLSVGNALRAT